MLEEFAANGSYFYDNGDRYEGEFLDGKRHGSGRYFFSDGNSYSGEWFEDLPHNYGTYYFTNGTHFQGSFLNGNIIEGAYYFSEKEDDGNWMKQLFTKKPQIV